MKRFYLTLLGLVLLFSAHSQSSTLVISQVYGGGQSAGATYNADYVELHNISNTSISLNGKSVQYGASGNTTWSGKFDLPNVSVPAGGYFLIRMSGTGAAGIALPTPDATSGTIGMSATGGKVALVNNTTLLTNCTSSMIDMVGYGTAVCFEGSAACPALTVTTAGFRALNGCQDTDQNGTDFSTATPAPRNSASPAVSCGATCSTPSDKPTNMRYGGSPTTTSMQVYFTRGNGTGTLVVARQGAPVNVAPTNGITYTANTAFGSGANLGGGNYAVFNTNYRGVNNFTMTGLTAGLKYYFSAFEYNDPGKCYTATGLVDSFIVGATVLHPGDMVFAGWDNSIVSGGEDKIYLMNLVDITPGTQFSITNSRFEAGAAANTRTNRWYGGGSDPFEDPDKHDFEYIGTTIPKGSVISMESNSAAGFINFTINGVSVPASAFSAKTGTSNFISNTGTDADQLFITQGKFFPYGTTGVDRYNLFNGLVIHGITVRTPWVSFSSAVSAATTGGNTRQSRIPPDILCINTEFPSSSLSFGAYNRAMSTTGTKNQLLSSFNNFSNWFTGAGGNTTDDPLASEPNINNSYTISTSNADGYWTGGSNDWFDCNNWQGLHVPDSTTVVTRAGSTPNDPVINVAASSRAPLYKNIAHAYGININTGTLSLTGTGNDKLETENFFNIVTGSIVQFENNSNASGDTIWVHGAFADQNFGGTNFVAGKGTVVMAETREPSTYNWIKYSGPFNFYNLVMDDSRNKILTNEFRISNNLNLQYGYLQSTGFGTSLTLAATATISSPANVYGQSNKGYQHSFVNGPLHYEADASTVTRVFPIGYYNGTDTAFAPVELEKTNTTPCTYDAQYFYSPYSDLTVDIAQLHHVSKNEHWLINSTVPSAQAKVTLSWRPRSQVGDGTPSLVPLDSLMVSHYFDDDGPGGNPSLWHVDGGSNVIMPKNAGYNVNYGLITTVASTGSFSPFTLGTRGNYNILPVKLLSFNASPFFSTVKLQWVTEAEQFVDRYEIEKSVDGTVFSYMGSVSSLNNTARFTYHSQDQSPFSGWNYYRLKIIDKNGKPSYSTISRVWMGKTSSLLVYPNPARNELKINLPASSSISIIQLVNMSGQVVKQLTTTDQSLTINIESLSNGLYIVKVINDQQTITQRFAKQ